jgi:SSS family solute:Na+ symporter
MEFNGTTFSVFASLFLLVTGMGFVAGRWKRVKKDRHKIDDWALGGRGFGGFTTWFLLGGDLYSAYTLIAVPAAIFSIGAFGFYAIPNAVVLYSLGFLILPPLVRLAHKNGYLTLTDFAQDRFKSRGLGLAITLTSLLATLPYLALQLVGLEVVFSAMGLDGGDSTNWFMKELPLLTAFAVLAAYTYSSGIRAPALIAFVKDGLTYLFVIVAVIVIPIKLGGFDQIFTKAGQVIVERTGNPDIQSALTSVDPTVYMTLALGSGMAFFLYPHSITGVFSAKGAKTVRRNMAVLPIYTVLLGLVALLGMMALAAGIKPKNGNPQFAVPQLIVEMFPPWFAGVAFAAIAMSALVPAAIMAIGSGNLVSRNLIGEFSRRKRSARFETEVSKIVSVLVKVGALVFVLTLDSSFALNFQLLGGIWMLQTLPTVLFGLFTKRFANKWGLIAGWASGIAYGTIAAYNVESAKAAHFGGSTAVPFFWDSPMYIAVAALLVNLGITVIVCTAVNILRGTDSKTTAPAPTDTHAEKTTVPETEPAVTG